MQSGQKTRAVLALAALACLLDSCYLAEQGAGLVSYLRRTEDISKILENTSDDSLRVFLDRALAIKQFAVDSLGLAEDRNYTTYLETESQSAAFVVSAARPDTFQMHRWCFPIVGCVPYKGYFKQQSAHAEATKLRAKGLDVYEWQAGAFSTLGFFPDPLLSYMKSYDPFALASLIVHEQTHATLYLKGQAQFNEEFASFVGREGALRYVAATFGDTSAQYRSALDRLADERTFHVELNRLYESLDSLYRLGLPLDTVRLRKAATIAAFKHSFAQSYDSLFASKRYRRFPEVNVNNAYLGVQRTYHEDLSLFERVHEKNNRDLRRTIDLLLKARDHPRDPKGYVESLVK